MTAGQLLAAASAAAALGLGVAQAAPEPTAPVAPAAMKVMSATFAVTDLDRAVDFYTKGLGLQAVRRIENPGNTEVPLLFPGGGMSLLLIRAKTPAATSPGQPPRVGRVILDVPDVRAVEARLAAAGYPLRQPAVENPTHHVIVGLATDPDGNELELVQRPR